MRLGFASSPFLVFSRESVLPVYRTLLSRPSSKKSFKRGLVCPNHPLRGPFSVDENTPLKFVEIASSLKQFRASCLAGNKQNALEIVQMLLYKTRSMETPLVPEWHLFCDLARMELESQAEGELIPEIFDLFEQSLPNGVLVFLLDLYQRGGSFEKSRWLLPVFFERVKGINKQNYWASSLFEVLCGHFCDRVSPVSFEPFYPAIMELEQSGVVTKKSSVYLAKCFVKSAKYSHLAGRWMVNMEGRFGANPKKGLWLSLLRDFLVHSHLQDAGMVARLMKKLGVVPNEYATFNAVLNRYGKTGFFRNSGLYPQLLLELQRTTAVVPLDGYSLNYLLNCQVKDGQLEQAASLVRQSETHANVVTYTTLLGGYLRNGDVKEAAGLFKEMQHKGVEPNLVTFTELISYAARSYGINEGNRLLKELRLVPDEILRVVLIKAATRQGDEQEMWAQYFQLCAETQDIPMHCYTIMLAFYNKIRNWHGVQKVLQEMQIRGKSPNKYIWTGLLRTALERNDPDRANQILKGLTKELAQDPFILLPILVYYSRQGLMREVKQVFLELHRLVVESEELQRNREKRERLLGHAWTCFIHAGAMSGDMEAAQRIFNQMEKTITPNTATYNVMLKGWQRREDLGLMKEWLQRMVKNGVEPDGKTMDILQQARGGLIKRGVYF